MAEATPQRWRFAAALPLTVACLAIGNLLGVIVTAIWGWDSVQKDQPGSVAVAFIQGYLGALIAMVASDHFLKSTEPGDFWVKWLVRRLRLRVVNIGGGSSIARH